MLLPSIFRIIINGVMGGLTHRYKIVVKMDKIKNPTAIYPTIFAGFFHQLFFDDFAFGFFLL
jgi:hypothetical protein